MPRLKRHNRVPLVVPSDVQALGVEADVDAFLLENFGNGSRDINYLAAVY
jgi:hypothetical protein